MNTRVSSNSLALFYPQYNGGQSQAIGRDQPTGDSSRRGLQNREDTATSEFIFSGELLESISEDKRYLPEYN
ncbi:MAG: hypothetical protein GY784_01580, partial [Gammaproteobacteria bacterium]|nr:hypothetical protein [Gammaproteobacteria bacterium]